MTDASTLRPLTEADAPSSRRGAGWLRWTGNPGVHSLDDDRLGVARLSPFGAPGPPEGDGAAVAVSARMSSSFGRTTTSGNVPVEQNGVAV